jgi:hypothetical protein
VCPILTDHYLARSVWLFAFLDLDKSSIIEGILVLPILKRRGVFKKYPLTKTKISLKRKVHQSKDENVIILSTNRLPLLPSRLFKKYIPDFKTGMLQRPTPEK